MNAPLHPDQLRAAPITLDDKYTQSAGQAFMSGVTLWCACP